LIGRHNVMNALAALAAASVWGVGADDAARVFPALAPADKRGEVVRFEEGFSIINDSYNSSPTALGAMVDLLAATRGYQRHIVAAGEMLELGDSAPQLHRECGRHAGDLRKIDWIFAVRGFAADFMKGALDAGHPVERAMFFEDSESAGQFLESFLRPGDLLLVKGSRGVRMEKILAAVERQHARAAKVAATVNSELSPKGRG
jgi:UDP-N-acetylmuramoyl-tripeptide--D-alanyl-D-alanine ligase